MNRYSIEYKREYFSISSTIEAYNKADAANAGSIFLRNDSLVPDMIKTDITAKTIIVKRIYKSKRDGGL